MPGFALGVDPVRFVIDTLGKTALNLLLITLAVTPVRQLTHLNNLIRLRRMLGLFVLFYACMHFLTYIGPFQGWSWHAILEDIATAVSVPAARRHEFNANHMSVSSQKTAHRRPLSKPDPGMR